MMTQLREQEHNVQMADMKACNRDVPSIGIFWYDQEDGSFFGVHKSELTPKKVEEAADMGMPFINYPQLHRLVWAKEFFQAQAKHEPTKFKGDYTRIPRGRVTWSINKFIVIVGKWAEPIQEKLTALLVEEFNLPTFEFVYDEHWDLGRKW